MILNIEKFQPNSYYHIYNHSIGDENLFRISENYYYFLEKFGKYISPVCDTYAYCLMPNHFHFLIKTKQKDDLLYFKQQYHKQKNSNEIISPHEANYHKIIMNQFQSFLNGYAQAYNKMFDRKGSLFIDFMKRKNISNTQYLTRLINYIHYNPVHHGFCKNAFEWDHSSIHAFTSNKKTKIERNEVLAWFSNKEEFLQQHKKPIYPSIISELEFY